MPPMVDAVGFRPETWEATATRPYPMIASIRHRWSLLADADVGNLETLENLAAAIQSTYGIGADRAAVQVRDWAAGRTLIRADIARGEAAAAAIGATMTRAATS